MVLNDVITGAFTYASHRLSIVLLPVLVNTLFKSALLFVIVAVVTRIVGTYSSRLRYVLWVSYIFSVAWTALYTSISSPLNFTVLKIFPYGFEDDGILSGLFYPLHEAWVLAGEYPVESLMYLKEVSNRSSLLLHWSFWLVCMWIAGTMLCIFHALVGRIGVGSICRNALPCRKEEVRAAVSCIAEDMGITREIEVLISLRCRLPFTYRIIHPVIVVPWEAESWPESKLRTVIIHELAHIRRHNYLVLSLLGLVCAVFWFNPLIWWAHRHLQLEQEKICDSFVVRMEGRPATYARHMIDLARNARGFLLWSGIFIMKGKNRSLEKRVTHVLGLKRPAFQKGRSYPGMKRNIFIFISFMVTALVIGMGGFASPRQPISYQALSRVFAGTWIREEKTDAPTERQLPNHQELILYEDGGFETYNYLVSDRPVYRGVITILDKWMDQDGNVWFECRWECMYCGCAGYQLTKISAAGDTMEQLLSTHLSYRVEEWDQDNSSYDYRIYHRL